MLVRETQGENYRSDLFAGGKEGIHPRGGVSIISIPDRASVFIEQLLELMIPLNWLGRAPLEFGKPGFDSWSGLSFLFLQQYLGS